jgi:hypothetical protein
MIKLYILTFLTCLTLSTSAQDKKFDFGFFTELSKRINRLEKTGDNFNDIKVQNNIGFGLGSNLYYLASDRLRIRLTVGVNFEKEELNYFSMTTKETKITEVGFITSGLHTMIKVNKNIPLNLIAGLTPYYGLRDNRNNRKDLDFKKFDLTGDIGLSYIISLKKLKVMPEITYSMGFINASADDSIYGQSIDSYYRGRLNFSAYLFTF